MPELIHFDSSSFQLDGMMKTSQATVKWSTVFAPNGCTPSLIDWSLERLGRWRRRSLCRNVLTFVAHWHVLRQSLLSSTSNCVSNTSEVVNLESIHVTVRIEIISVVWSVSCFADFYTLPSVSWYLFHSRYFYMAFAALECFHLYYFVPACLSVCITFLCRFDRTFHFGWVRVSSLEKRHRAIRLLSLLKTSVSRKKKKNSWFSSIRLSASWCWDILGFLLVPRSGEERDFELKIS